MKLIWLRYHTDTDTFVRSSQIQQDGRDGDAGDSGKAGKRKQAARHKQYERMRRNRARGNHHHKCVWYLPFYGGALAGEFCRICSVKPAISIQRIGSGAYMRNVVCAPMAVMFALSLSLAGQVPQSSSHASLAASFDVPDRVLHVDLGRSPYFPEDNIRNTLSCHYFPGLMVKEYDQGEVGSEWLAIHRYGEKQPECSMLHEPGEQVIEPSKWGSYFRGIKGTLVFFYREECQQGACKFGVYDLIAGKWIFEDDEAYQPAVEPARDPMQVISTNAGTVIRYLRASYADCDLHLEGKTCWDRVRAKFNLISETMPHCKGYEPEALARFGEDPKTPVPSMISYPVEVALSARPVVKNLAGPVRCWATH